MVGNPLSPFGCRVSFVVGSCLIIGCTAALFRYLNGQYLLQRIDCGEGREILITAARSWEVGQPYCYVVRINGKVVVPTSGLGTVDHDVVQRLQFEKHWLAGHDVVAVSLRSVPDRFVVIHDFRDNSNWPRQHVSPLSKFGPVTGLDLDAAKNRARIEAAYGSEVKSPNG